MNQDLWKVKTKVVTDHYSDKFNIKCITSAFSSDNRFPTRK